MPPQQKVPIEDVCKVFEIPISSWAVRGHLSVEQARTALEEFKAIVKTQRKMLAKKYHPDKTGGDDTRIKKINAMYDVVMKLEITVLRQRPQPHTIKFHFSSNPFSNDSSTESSNFFRFR